MRKLLALIAASILCLDAWTQETTDKLFLELYGPVQHVKYSNISNVTAEGQPTTESTRWEGDTYNLNKQGRITSATMYGKPISITRNAQGNIQRIVVPNTSNTTEDDGYAYTVIWKENGYPKRIVYDKQNFTTCQTTYVYSKIANKLAAIDYCEVEESEGWETITCYRILETDDLYSNWTKRLKISIDYYIYETQSMTIDLETRTIKYFESEEDIEIARMREKEAAQQAAAEKEAAKQREAEERAKALISTFGPSSEAGGGATGAAGTGKACKGASGDISWSMSGRGIIGRLPKPANTFNQEGTVMVQIRINAAGLVIDASIAKGTTIADKQTQQFALDAAKKAKFTKGDRDQIGTITYYFKFN